MDIGTEKEQTTIEPIESPVPAERREREQIPDQEPEPVEAPAEEPEKVPA